MGASNEQPPDDRLLAFYDRFLLRVPVFPVDDAHFARLPTDPCVSLAPADHPLAPTAGVMRAAHLGHAELSERGMVDQHIWRLGIRLA